MLIPTRDAADTLGSLESLQARTLADTFRWAWLIWLFWAAVYLASVLVFLTAPNWAIGLYWLCTIPIAVAATIVVLRRLPRRAGVVPLQGLRLVFGSVAVAVRRVRDRLDLAARVGVRRVVRESSCSVGSGRAGWRS